MWQFPIWKICSLPLKIFIFFLGMIEMVPSRNIHYLCTCDHWCGLTSSYFTSPNVKWTILRNISCCLIRDVCFALAKDIMNFSIEEWGKVNAIEWLAKRLQHLFLCRGIHITWFWTHSLSIFTCLLRSNIINSKVKRVSCDKISCVAAIVFIALCVTVEGRFYRN
jgi:hypothetical protein